MLGGIGGRRRRGRQRMRGLDGITDSMDMSLSKLWSWWWTGMPGMLRFMGSQRIRRDWATELTHWLCARYYTGLGRMKRKKMYSNLLSWGIIELPWRNKTWHKFNKNILKIFLNKNTYQINATLVAITFQTLIEQWRVKKYPKARPPQNSVENSLFQRVFTFYQDSWSIFLMDES